MDFLECSLTIYYGFKIFVPFDPAVLFGKFYCTEIRASGSIATKTFIAVLFLVAKKKNPGDNLNFHQ